MRLMIRLTRVVSPSSWSPSAADPDRGASWPELINCSTKDRSTLFVAKVRWIRTFSGRRVTSAIDAYETMMAASIVSRKIMKKMETEKRSFAILKSLVLCFYRVLHLERELFNVLSIRTDSLANTTRHYLDSLGTSLYKSLIPSLRAPHPRGGG